MASSKMVAIHHWKQSDWQTYSHSPGYHRHSIWIIDCNKAANVDIPISDKLILADFIYIHSVINACAQHFILLSFNFNIFHYLIKHFCFNLVQIHRAWRMSKSLDIITKWFLDFILKINHYFIIKISTFLFSFNKN